MTAQARDGEAWSYCEAGYWWGWSDDENVVGTYYSDAANSSLSHTAAYTYNPTHRLTSAVATGTSTYNLAFSFDRYGNMTCSQNQNTNGPCPQYSFNSSTNQISNSGYTYDASGDLTGDGVHTYQYDAEGRLISVDSGSTATYVYNGLGERVEKVVSGTYTEYMFDKDGNPLGENNRTTWTDTWVLFNSQHVAHYQNGETYFMHANNVGTTAFVTDYTGGVIQDETHYPWGQEWAMQGIMEEERFASLQHRDSETSLDPTPHRMYASGQGRWLTPDPVRSCAFHPENFDRYNYAVNNPGNRIDPKGTCVSQSYCDAAFTACMGQAGNGGEECYALCQLGAYYCLHSGGGFLECVVEESACDGACLGLQSLLAYSCESAHQNCLADVCGRQPSHPPRPRPRY